MRLIYTIPSIAEVSSGPTYAVVRLARQMRGRGHELTLACLDSPNHAPVPDWVLRFPRLGIDRRLGTSPPMKRWLRSIAPGPPTPLIHNHSLWMMPNVYPGNAARKLSIPYVVTPHGTLRTEAFNSGSVVKRAFWPLVQKPALAAVSCYHATSGTEAKEIHGRGFGKPIAVIPNGIDLPVASEEGPRRREVLYVGRIHPIKGIDVLLRAWKRVEPLHGDWILRIVGPDNSGHLARMQALSAELGLRRVRFEGELVDDAKIAAYRSASVYVLPSLTENFAMTVAEALACATPAIVSHGAPWEGLETRKCGWWVNAEDEALQATLHQAMSSEPSILREMGARGREWMASEFSWDAVGSRMEDLYRWVAKGMPSSETPSTVIARG